MNTKDFDAHNATCTRCGMLALRDPWLHRERYRHDPEFMQDGQLMRFLTSRGISVPVEQGQPFTEEARQ